MIACPNCSKENQDHYKFCLGCGAKLAAPAPVTPPTPLLLLLPWLPPPQRAVRARNVASRTRLASLSAADAATT
jgi:hypothetical protein